MDASRNADIYVISSDDSTNTILTPDCLLLGRSMARNAGNWKDVQTTKQTLQLIEHVSQTFWKHWSDLYVPTMVFQSK